MNVLPAGTQDDSGDILSPALPEKTDIKSGQKAAWREAYEAYTAKPTPDNMKRVLAALRPTISYAVASVGGLQSPAVHSKAKVLAAQAVKTYNPNSGVSLPTWANRQLLGLRRFKRVEANSVRIPEKTQLDAMNIEKAKRELEDKLGREPTAEEIADETGLSIKRLETVAQTYKKTPSENAFGDAGGAAIAAEIPSFHNEAVDYVYRELDPVDKKILEHKTGIGGASILENVDIAKKLKLHPSQISRRLARIAMLVHDIETDLEKLYAN